MTSPSFNAASFKKKFDIKHQNTSDIPTAIFVLRPVLLAADKLSAEHGRKDSQQAATLCSALTQTCPTASLPDTNSA